MCSFDICSLFTGVPILETINISADMLYLSHLTQPDIPEAAFVELIKFATTSVELSFNNIMYRQVDGISMGLVLEFSWVSMRLISFLSVRYLMCTFAMLMMHSVYLIVRLRLANFSHLNKRHPSLRFTLEKKSNSKLPFLDVLVYKEASYFLTSVYFKLSFTGLYIRWDSFCPKMRKLNLIKTLVHRALMVCSESKLDCKVSFITETLWNNGFP